MVIVIVSILALLIGVVMGYWLAWIISISDLMNAKAQLKARVDALEELIEHYEGKNKNEIE